MISLSGPKKYSIECRFVSLPASNAFSSANAMLNLETRNQKLTTLNVSQDAQLL